jgi:ADP-heptose:LPS heptosyltransferase
MALPALEALKRAHPAAKFTWIVEGRARNILEGHPHLDEIIEFPRTKIRKEWKERFGLLKTIPTLARFRRELRSRRFDATIDFQGNLKSAVCTLFAGAPVRAGYERAECREPNWLFTNRKLAIRGESMHRVDRDLLLAGRLGAAFEYHAPQIAFSAADKEVGDRFFATLPRGRKVVLVHPGTSDFMPHKRWSLQSYARAARMIQDGGHVVVVTWGPGELPMAEETNRLAGGSLVIAPETPSMKSLGWLIRRSNLVIGADTGPVHLGVVQGIDVVIVLGPADPRHYYPLHHPDRTFYERVPCSPCRFRACPDLICMAGIDPEPVGRKALEILSGSRAPTDPA